MSNLSPFPCRYDRNNRWTSIQTLKQLAVSHECTHIVFARSPTDAAHPVDIVLTASAPCFGSPSDSQKAGCKRPMERELWVACAPVLAGRRRRSSEPILVATTLKSLHPHRLKFLCD